MGRSRCCTCAVTTGTARCCACAWAVSAAFFWSDRRTSQIATARTATTPRAARIHRLIVASPSASQSLEQLRSRRGEPEIRLHHLGARLRLGDLRVAQLDHAAGAVLVTRLGLLEAIARRGE